MDMKMCECYADDDLSPLDTQASTLPVLPELKLLYSLQIITCMRMGIRSVLTEVVHECRSNFTSFLGPCMQKHERHSTLHSMRSP